MLDGTSGEYMDMTYILFIRTKKNCLLREDSSMINIGARENLENSWRHWSASKRTQGLIFR